MDANHVFVSYRSTEIDFSLKLAADLKNAGIKLWMDRLDGIHVGMDWRDAIEKAVNTCVAIIVVLTPEYRTSEYCRKELARANTLKRPIFPVLLRSVKPEEVPLVLEGIQYEDFTNWTDEGRYKESLGILIARIKGELGGQIDNFPDAESRYLTSLVAELESRKGVLEYVVLMGQTSDVHEVRPQASFTDEWGFSELVQRGSTVGIPNVTKRIPLKDISVAVDRYPRFVLVGDPGSGKTTMVRHLALESVWMRLENPNMCPLPFLVYLAQWESGSLEDFLKQKWPFDTNPLNGLRTGNIILYMDGLNEMGASRIEKGQLIRNWLHSENAPAHIIITCRVGDYAGSLKFSELPTILVQELDVAQIRQVSENYLGHKADSFLANIFSEKEKQFATAGNLSRLANNPYMLSALIYLYENLPSGELPQNTGTLSQRLIFALWKREELRNSVKSYPFDRVEKAFSLLAYSMIDQDKTGEVSLDYANELIQDENLIYAGVNASFITLRAGKLGFYHQLMQDYFAAKMLLGATLDKQLTKPMLDPQHWYISSKWDQVLISLCGITDDANSLVKKIAIENPILAMQCILSGVQLDTETQNFVLAHIFSMLLSKKMDVGKITAEALLRISLPYMALLLSSSENDYSFKIPFIARRILGKSPAEIVARVLDDLRSRNFAKNAIARAYLGMTISLLSRGTAQIRNIPLIPDQKYFDPFIQQT